MSASPARAADVERLLTFEVASSVYAVPIAEVHEVAEAGRICCVPTISLGVVGVMNWHGDALPVVSTPLLLEEDAAEPSSGGDLAPHAGAATGAAEARGASQESEVVEAGVERLAGQHVLVVSARDDEPAQLGLPIDRVIGLVDGPRCPRGGRRLVVERRPVESRVVSVLDPCRLVERATEVIERVA